MSPRSDSVAPYYADDLLELHHGNARDVAAMLAPASVQAVVTSPPYFGLRDYGDSQQFGTEATLGDYVANLVDLFDAIRPALADDGTVWLNLGDSYARRGARSDPSASSYPSRKRSAGQHGAGAQASQDLPAKNLLGVPWRVAFALQDAGWILRSEVIWEKPNAMPESAADRPSRSHEHLFMLTKSPRYFYDSDAVKVRYEGSRAASRRAKSGNTTKENSIARAYVPPAAEMRNRRTVWPVPTAPFSGAHFAVYPPDLIRPCILASSRPGDTVLDPFSGSGTTGMVANEQGRRYVGIDLNSTYLDLSLATRFAAPPLNLTGVA